MPYAKLPDLDSGAVVDMVGMARFVQAMHYVRRRAVTGIAWDPQQRALHGMVHDPNGTPYRASAYLAQTGSRQFSLDRGRCSCQVQSNCEHVVALALSAANGPARPAALAPAELLTGPVRSPSPPAARAPVGVWTTALDSLIGPRPGAKARRPVTVPLAIEVALAGNLPGARSPGLTVSADPPRLLARLVQAGKNGGWIAGDLSWGRLDDLQYCDTFAAAQVRLLQEFLAVYRSRAGRADKSYPYYSRSGDKTVELSAFESRQLWPLLDQMESAGMKLVYPRKLGIVDRYLEAEFCLDVAADGTGALAITPRLRIAGALPDVRLVRFIGADGHGVVYADRAETEHSGPPPDWRIRLARLSRDVPRQLQDMAQAAARLQIPAEGQEPFLTDYCPRLRQLATIISSDDSFEPPEISGPTLLLHAAYQADHRVQAEWHWAYQVGGSRLTAPLPGGPADSSPADSGPAAYYRDLAGERRVLASLDLSPDHLGPLRAHDESSGSGLALSPRVQLSGADTMRFTTDLLPALTELPGVAVEISGDPAVYCDAGESLQICVSADALTADQDWFDLGVAITVGGREVPFAPVFVALSQGESHLLLDDGTYFSLARPELQALARLIAEAQSLVDSPPGSLRISRFQAGYWDELAALGIVTRQARAWQEQVQGLLSAGAIEGTEPPAGLRAQLRPYQLDGFGWLAFLWQHRLGGILADDMGLGKTLQCLALISHARQADPAAAPFLIVAPTSVVSNWVAEGARFTPGLTVVPVSGTTSRSGQELGTAVAGADVVVTSYTLLRLDFTTYQGMEWSGLILDEAQYAKNFQSKIYECVRRLKAPVKLAITGTPMENNLTELWSLLSIVAPGLFPSLTRFRDYYARPIEKGGQADLLAQLQRRIKPLVRRRTKEQVAADLPPKQEQVLEVELNPRHRKLYQTYLQRERKKVLGLVADMNTNRFTILRSLTLLRQLSLHAGLIDGQHRDLPSGKIEVLLGQLAGVVGGGHRALVFSQFTGFLGLVRERLEKDGVPYCYLDGSTRDRPAVIRQFKEGTAPVFLISLKAGGFGLNLTEADYCFLLDPWWNPATEAQAVDRAHRIGQDRTVMVYRLIAKDTIEEKVMALKARKSELFASVLDSTGAFGASIEAEDIRGLFG